MNLTDLYMRILLIPFSWPALEEESPIQKRESKNVQSSLIGTCVDLRLIRIETLDEKLRPSFDGTDVRRGIKRIIV
jgi:hypothetical protein